jgi:hypothetical protein
MMKAYIVALGYYLNRKASGASKEELAILLNQMTAVYGSAGVDMSIVNLELRELNKQPNTAVQPTPVKSIESKPVEQQKAIQKTIAPEKGAAPATVKPVAKPKAKEPARKASSSSIKLPANIDLERAWRYYSEVVEREISDHERIELLQEMLHRFGEQGASKINKELDRIRRRLE